jgi:ABC-2 type transport system permease protein
MRAEIATRELADRRRGLVAWPIAYLGMVAISVAAWPSIRDQPELQDFVDELPDALTALMGGADIDFLTATGYINSRLFAFVFPIMLLVYVIGFGARAVAGEHQDGRLDLVLSYPLTRRRYLGEKAALLAALVAGFVALIGLSVVALGALVDLGLSLGELWPACVMLWAFGVCFGYLAMAVGCVTLDRSLALAIPAGLAIGGWLIGSLAAVVAWLEPIRAASPIWWYSATNPMITGLDIHGLVLLGGGAVVALLIALLAFDRRNLTA